MRSDDARTPDKPAHNWRPALSSSLPHGVPLLQQLVAAGARALWGSGPPAVNSFQLLMANHHSSVGWAVPSWPLEAGGRPGRRPVLAVPMLWRIIGTYAKRAVPLASGVCEVRPTYLGGHYYSLLGGLMMMMLSWSPEGARRQGPRRAQRWISTHTHIANVSRSTGVCVGW